MNTERPSSMTKKQFEELAQRIKNNCVNETHKMSFDRWEDSSGNWYRVGDAGFSQNLCYAGAHYFVKYKYVPGVPSECSISIWEYTNE